LLKIKDIRITGTYKAKKLKYIVSFSLLNDTFSEQVLTGI